MTTTHPGNRPSIPPVPPAPGATPTYAAQAIELTKVYGTGGARVIALDDVSVGFRQGELTAIMGPSGSGKSTLLHCVAGLDSPTEGVVVIGDTALRGLSDTDLTRVRRERIGFIFQSFNLLPMLTARQNIELPHELAGTRPDPGWLAQVVEVLGIADRLDHRPSQLSGGQQQRVAAARALVMRPEVIVADEPTGALDRASSAQLLDFLRRSVRELGQTVVMVTHDPVAASYAGRVVLLADGRLAGEVTDPSADTVIDAMRELGA